MSIGAYIQTNIFPIAALIVVRANMRKNISYSWRQRDLSEIMLLMAWIMLFNVMGWMLDGVPGTPAYIVLWICNTAYYVLMEFMAFLWFLFMYDKLTDGNGQFGKSVLPKAVPFLIGLVLLLVAPFKPLIFYIDRTNHYVRGSMHYIGTLISAGYITAASILAVCGLFREKTAEVKAEYLWLAMFGLFPIVGGIFQTLFYGLDVLWPLTTVALIMVYLNMQWRSVNRDAMTGLYNRHRMDQYIQNLREQGNKNRTLCYSILDIDRFKLINDNVGHQAGDEVIRLVAEQLKNVYGNTTTFLARYGGDEFAIISRNMSEDEIERCQKELELAVEDIIWGKGKGWPLGVSIGRAFYGDEGNYDIDKIMELADARMYQVKRTKHDI